MVNKSKAKGTAAESAVVAALRANGFPTAERRALHGNTDLGDILTPGICWEVKGGTAAEVSAPANVETWLRQTQVERQNCDADVGVLVCKRAGFGASRAEQWWAWITLAELLLLHGQHTPDPRAEHIPVRLELGDVLHILRRAGYGDAL